METKLIFSVLRLLSTGCQSRAAVQKQQRAALRNLIRYAYHHSDFYHQLYTGAGITAETIDTVPIEKLPTINKAVLMENYRQILTVPEDFGQEALREHDRSGDGGRYLGKYQVVHSSGSTGIPRFFLYDDAAWSAAVAGALSCILQGVPMGKIAKLLAGGARIMFLGAVGGFGGASLAQDAMRGLHASMCTVDINEPLEKWAERYLEFMPNFIVGYPTAIRIMAEQVQGKLPAGSVSLICTSGEPLSAANRAYIRTVFGANVINFYAASESLAIGSDLGQGGDLYLPDCLNYIEVQGGKMYLTNLTNYAQPLIRYEITDCMELIPEQQRSHRLPFTQCKLIKGRDDDIFWFRDESGHAEFLHPLTMEDFCIEGLLDYQILQDSSNSFHVNVELAADTEPEQVIPLLTRQIQAVLNAHGLRFIRFWVDEVELILPDARTGKKRLAVPLPRAAEKNRQEVETHAH